MLGDDALVLAQRLTQWITARAGAGGGGRTRRTSPSTCSARPGCCWPGPAPSAVGRSRPAATDSIPDEDALAFFRDADEFRNTGLVEAANGDFGRRWSGSWSLTTVRLAVFTRLRDSRDPVLAAIAAKGVNELAYHRDYAARWVLRLGDGTPESHRRAQAGAGRGLAAAGRALRRHRVEHRLTAAGVAVDPATVRDEVRPCSTQVLERATLRPCRPGPRTSRRAGRHGGHDRSWPSCSPSCRAGPGASGGDVVTDARLRRARRPRRVTDPELPMLTLADLGVLRDVRTEADGTVVVDDHPDVHGLPRAGGYARRPAAPAARGRLRDVDVRTALAPPWSTDWITPAGRRKLAAAGMAPPGPAPVRPSGPVPLRLGADPPPAAARSAARPTPSSCREFGADRLHGAAPLPRLREPFEHVKEI